MGLFRDFFRGKLHVYYGLILLWVVGIWQVLQSDFLWLLVVIVCTGCLVDLYIHRYEHLPPPSL
jgi:hypothetical protein